MYSDMDTSACAGSIARAYFVVDDRRRAVGIDAGELRQVAPRVAHRQAASRLQRAPLTIEYRLHMASLRSAASAGRQATRRGEN